MQIATVVLKKLLSWLFPAYLLLPIFTVHLLLSIRLFYT